MVKVSIVFPTKNCVGILERCLRSIWDLDFPKEESEVIIVDGHCTDGTVDVAKKYGGKVVFENNETISAR